jgi:hypothetical protein
MDEPVSERGRRVIDALEVKGVQLGFTTAREYPVQGGRLDVVWLLPATTAIRALTHRCLWWGLRWSRPGGPASTSRATT